MNVWELITNASSLPVQSGTTFWDHINNLTGDGEPYPVPVEMINVPNIEINTVVATQISSQVANAGISNQVAPSQVDEQTANEQITSNTGNKC